LKLLVRGWADRGSAGSRTRTAEGKAQLKRGRHVLLNASDLPLNFIRTPKAGDQEVRSLTPAKLRPGSSASAGFCKKTWGAKLHTPVVSVFPGFPFTKISEPE